MFALEPTREVACTMKTDVTGAVAGPVTALATAPAAAPILASAYLKHYPGVPIVPLPPAFIVLLLPM